MAEQTDNSADWLVTVAGFDESLFEDVKSGCEPPIVRKPSTTIYFVPEALSRLKPEAYRWRFIHLAIHYQFDSLFPKGTIKNKHVLDHMHSILSRNKKRGIEDYLKAMKEMSERIKNCHTPNYNMDFKRLLMGVFSACFIVDTLLLFYDGKLSPAFDDRCSSNFQYLWMDLLLVENQIPFFVLQRVYNMVVITQEDDQPRYPPLVKLCFYFFDPLLETNMFDRPLLMESESIHHLLHLVHHYLLPCHQNYPPMPSPPSSRFHHFFQSINLTKLKKRLCPSSAASNPIPGVENNTAKRLTIKPIPSAKRLQDAGIKLKKTEAQGFCNISFNRRKGVLQIPYLHIDFNTEILLRNLIAWEQCHPEILQYFTGYAIFMDYIVNSAKDVEILQQNGIMEQSLGSEEDVASIFNGLSTNLVYKGDDGGHLPALCRHINEYCRNDFNIWRAKLMADYFSSPWTIVSLIAAFILLLFTLTQTFFSAFSYFRPP